MEGLPLDRAAVPQILFKIGDKIVNRALVEHYSRQLEIAKKLRMSIFAVPTEPRISSTIITLA